ncbi:hypothetical protein EV424DRAFT_1563977 [Suillus variegatus]|nr:hypothetical protein EV424DRAFT_1563977 [Suillus variegatus]
MSRWSRNMTIENDPTRGSTRQEDILRLSGSLGSVVSHEPSQDNRAGTTPIESAHKSDTSRDVYNAVEITGFLQDNNERPATTVGLVQVSVLLDTDHEAVCPTCLSEPLRLLPTPTRKTASYEPSLLYRSSEFYDQLSSLESALQHAKTALTSCHLFPLPQFAREVLPPRVNARVDKCKLPGVMALLLVLNAYYPAFSRGRSFLPSKPNPPLASKKILVKLDDALGLDAVWQQLSKAKKSGEELVVTLTGVTNVSFLV